MPPKFTKKEPAKKEPAPPAEPEKPKEPVFDAKAVKVAFTKEQINQFSGTFVLFDKAGDMKVPLNMVGDVIRALKFNPTNLSVSIVQGKLKPEEMEGKMVDFDQFLVMLQFIVNLKEEGTVEDFKEGLKLFDKEGNGTVLAPEVRQFLVTLGEKMPLEDVDFLLAGLEDAEGYMKIDEFITRVMAG